MKHFRDGNIICPACGEGPRRILRLNLTCTLRSEPKVVWEEMLADPTTCMGEAQIQDALRFLMVLSLRQ
ncbi:hypothetical protein ACHHYP_20353 [Achlya hypogyna]|uniref:Uncharacterized protein n=1 Tax=Achlya hypogyna TaxID=1202772 RepID=A0A1V9YPS0_ACHHY|nr:hypothetical protein ACHHYP_20353 [Achlya hypogyna]